MGSVLVVKMESTRRGIYTCRRVGCLALVVMVLSHAYRADLIDEDVHVVGEKPRPKSSRTGAGAAVHETFGNTMDDLGELLKWAIGTHCSPSATWVTELPVSHVSAGQSWWCTYSLILLFLHPFGDVYGCRVLR